MTKAGSGPLVLIMCVMLHLVVGCLAYGGGGGGGGGGPPVPAPPSVPYYVSTDGSSLNDGLSENTAKATIQEGVDAASAGDTVIILPGTYTGDGNCEVQVAKSLTVSGQTGERHDVVVDCELKSSVFTFQSQPGPHGSENVITLSSLTVANGWATSGAGVRIIRANAIFTNVLFEHNIAELRGGAISLDADSMGAVTACWFRHNEATSAASVAWDGASGSISNTQFHGNSALDASVGLSGARSFTISNCNFIGEHTQAITTVAAVITITDSTFADLDWTNVGGVLAMRSGVITMSDVVIRNITAQSAIFNLGNVHGVVSNVLVQGCVVQSDLTAMQADADLTVTNITYLDNLSRSTSGALILRSSDGQILIQNSLFKNNHAEEDGGAIAIRLNQGLAPVILNSRFVGNTAAVLGGVLSVLDGQLDFVDCVLENNTAIEGGALHVLAELEGVGQLAVRLTNSTVRNNKATRGGALYLGGQQLVVDSDTTIEGNEAEYGGGIYITGNEHILDDEGSYRNNRATIGGGAQFVDTEKLVKKCDCKGNKAGYGNTFATFPSHLKLIDINPKEKRLKLVESLHTDITVELALEDRYEQSVSGMDVTFAAFIAPANPSTLSGLLINSDEKEEGGVLEPINSNSGTAKFQLAVVGEFDEKYNVTFTVLGFESLGEFFFTTTIVDCDDDEYLENYPPGVQIYQICEDPSFVGVTDTMKVMRWVFGALAGVGLLIALFSFPIIIYFRERKAINYASPIFSLIILGGVVVGFAAVFPFLVEPTDAACCLRPVFILLAFGIMLTPLIVRNYRLWRLFDNKTFTVLVITNAQLLWAVGIILAIEIGILILWLAWSTPEWHWHYDDDTDDERVKTCTSDNNIIMLSIAATFNGILILVALFFAFKTRGVADGFNEAKWIAMIIYMVAFVSVLFLPLILLSDDASFKRVMACIAILLCTAVVYICLFGHKFWILFTKQDLAMGYGLTHKFSTYGDRTKDRDMDYSSKSFSPPSPREYSSSRGGAESSNKSSKSSKS